MKLKNKLKYIIILISIYTIFIYRYFNFTNYLYKYVENYNINYVPQITISNYNYGNITAYTPNCYGCIGITASGLNVKNNMYYFDNEYKNLRILAADSRIPFGSIIYFYDFDIYAIVLDRGSAIGYNKETQFDLLFLKEEEAINFGKKNNIKYSIIREGF